MGDRKCPIVAIILVAKDYLSVGLDENLNWRQFYVEFYKFAKRAPVIDPSAQSVVWCPCPDNRQGVRINFYGKLYGRFFEKSCATTEFTEMQDICQKYTY